MKHKKLSQMNKERKTKLKPMTREEEYRNADVPMPKDEDDDYSGGKAYTEFLRMFFKGKKDE
tara:strand:+ start:7 stop:192 length:186 start_codon:yes stop_codon:yes gene_type:complete